MSPNPEACEEELPFREGQLIKVRANELRATNNNPVDSLTLTLLLAYLYF